MIYNHQIEVNIENLQSTEKTHIDIKKFSNELSLRERQFLIMLTSYENSYDYEERKAKMNLCNNLISKIDANSLIERGYLDLKGDYDLDLMSSQIKLSDYLQTDELLLGEESFVGDIQINDDISKMPQHTKTQPTTKSRKSQHEMMHDFAKEQAVLLRFASGNFDS